MRRFLISLLMLLLLISPAFAQAEYGCQVPENLASPVARGITNALGFNFLTKKAAKTAMIKVLKRNAEGDYDVKIDSFSAMDLKKGKFKSLEIEGKNISTHGVYVSSVVMNTICDYNYVDYWKRPVIFYTDLPLYFKAEITEEDLNKTLVDLGYIKKLTDLNIAGVSLFTVDNVVFKMKNNKIYLIAQMKAPFLMGERVVKFTFSGKLNVENGKIVLDNLQSENLRNINLNAFVDIINSMNPFDLPLRIFRGADSTLSINNIKILDNKMYVDGIMVIKRSYNGQTKEETE